MCDVILFGIAIVLIQFAYEFDEKNGILSVSFILPGLFGTNYTFQLEKAA